MGASLQTILGAPNLTGIIQKVLPGLAADLIPPEFLAPKRRVVGSVAEFTGVEGERRMARKSPYGSSTLGWEAKGLDATPVKLIHAGHNIQFKPADLMAIFKPDSTEMQDFAVAEIERELIDFTKIFANLRTATVTSVLANQAIYFNAVGEVQATSTNANYTLPFQMPSGNQAQLNVFGTGNIIDATWATAGTNIIDQIKSIKIASRKLTGYQLKYAFYGKKIFNYLATNTTIQTYMKFNPGYQESFKKLEIPNGFFGMMWIPMEEAFLVNMATNPGGAISSEVVASTFGDNLVYFTPSPSDGKWWDFVEGSEMIPTTIDIAGETDARMGTLKQINGLWAYAKPEHDPVRLVAYMGDNFLPYLSVPKATFAATVAGF